MKELSIEEKARAYDEAIKRAKNHYSTTDSSADIKLIGLIFPELKENEDERMIQYFKDLASFDKADELYEKYGFSHKDAIAWLEKQGGHAKFINKIQVGDKVTRNEDGVLVNLSQLNRVAKKDEKQGGQKPADKVEPKFKVGDWVVCCDYEPVQIIDITINGYYEMSNGDIRPIYTVDNNHNLRLWTIQDAKDGNVLRIENLTFIFQEITNDNVCHKDAVVAYCSYEDNDNAFGVSGPDCITDLELVTPATKEQRDILFARMKEAGYKWDAEKKELKKIEQKFAEWSEEDDKIINYLIALLQDSTMHNPALRTANEESENLLKSLRPQNTWKPSESDIIILEQVISGTVAPINYHATLYAILEQLKKLREGQL